MPLSPQIALLEAGADFVARFRAAGASSASPAAPAASSSAVAPSRASASGASGAASSSRPLLPLIASACPGWVCYAEKSVGEAAVPLLSSAMSPQAVAGVVAKQLWSRELARSAALFPAGGPSPALL